MTIITRLSQQQFKDTASIACMHLG